MEKIKQIGIGSGKYKRPSTIDLFMKKIIKSDTCWIWNGSFNSEGRYGAFYFNKKVGRAHRFSFEHYKGNIPKGMVVMHSCDNTKCVNPEHLSIGTQRDNIIDMINKGRMSEVRKPRIKISLNNKDYEVIKSECVNGHDLLNKDNLYFKNKSAQILCRVCKNLCNKAYRERNKKNG